jgi:hypothetical protein
VAEEDRERHNGSASALEFLDATLFLFHCYKHNRQYHFLFDIDATAQRYLCGLDFPVRQCYDWCWIEYGMDFHLMYDYIVD